MKRKEVPTRNSKKDKLLLYIFKNKNVVGEKMTVTLFWGFQALGSFHPNFQI